MIKDIFRYSVKVIFGVLMIILLFLIALNGRYENMGNGFVLDKWKKEVHKVGTMEIPVTINNVYS